MAKVEKLVVELDAKIDDYIKKMTKVEKKNKSTGMSAKEMGKGVAGAVITMGKTAVATIASIMALSKVVASYSKELKVASDLSGVAIEELQLMAHATATVGISIEQLGDISKDTREKIGDFLNTGGGGFKDFADAMGLTKEQTKEAANEFAVMSGPQILQEMVKRMEAANMSAVQMSHALEGMASDTTKLIPLLTDGGKAMKGLVNDAKQVVIPLSKDDVDLFIRMGKSTDIAGAALKSLGEQTLLKLGERFIEVTEVIANFFAVLNVGSLAQKKNRIIDIDDEIKDAEAAIKRADGFFAWASDTEEFRDKTKAMNKGKINNLLAERLRLIKEIVVAESSGGAPVLTTDLKPPEIPSGKLVDPNDKTKAETAAALDALKERLVAFESSMGSELDLLMLRYEDEKALIQDNTESKAEQKEQLLTLEAEYLERIGEMGQTEFERIQSAYDDEVALNKEKLDRQLIDQETHDMRLKALNTKKDKALNKDKEKYQKENRNSMLTIASAIAGDNEKMNKAIYITSQALAASDVFFNTQRAAMRAMADLGPIAGAPVAASIEASGMLSIAAIAATTLGSLSGGGGGGVGSSGDGGSSSSAPIQNELPQPETSTLDVTEQSESGISEIRLVITDESGNEFLDGIANGLNERTRQGR